MNETIIDEMVACEFKRFSVGEYRGIADAPEFEIVPGSAPVIVSAPHAVTHLRNERIKPSEDFTGALALAVAQASSCHAIVATRTGQGDPNWDPFENSTYKQALCAYARDAGIACVLDIHGMVAASEALVAIGSADGKTVTANPGLDERVAETLRAELDTWCKRFEKPIVLNGRLGARSQNTIAQTVARECGIAALQIEVATQLRVPARLAGHVPRGERIPFSKTELPVEIAVRRSAEPAAVLALVNALSGIVDTIVSRAS